MSSYFSGKVSSNLNYSFSFSNSYQQKSDVYRVTDLSCGSFWVDSGPWQTTGWISRFPVTKHFPKLYFSLASSFPSFSKFLLHTLLRSTHPVREHRLIILTINWHIIDSSSTFSCFPLVGSMPTSHKGIWETSFL